MRLIINLSLRHVHVYYTLSYTVIRCSTYAQKHKSLHMRELGSCWAYFLYFVLLCMYYIYLLCTCRRWLVTLKRIDRGPQAVSIFPKLTNGKYRYFSHENFMVYVSRESLLRALENFLAVGFPKSFTDTTISVQHIRDIYNEHVQWALLSSWRINKNKKI